MARSTWMRLSILCGALTFGTTREASTDHVRQLQMDARQQDHAGWGHWGATPPKYSDWSSHSNRLIPIYAFGISLRDFSGRNSHYRHPKSIADLYGWVPFGTLNTTVDFLDQTDVYRLQTQAIESGKKYIILMIFDGMDWQTTRAAAIYKSRQVGYSAGRGSGLFFQDYRGVETDFGSLVTSPHNTGTKTDLNAQTVSNPGGQRRGGYSARIGGRYPWNRPVSHQYLLGKLRNVPHVVTDSAASATSMTCGIKTYNGAINVHINGRHVVPIARRLQSERQFSIGVVTSVPISHATPAAAYANNVSRNDYQDLTRDLLGQPSISHPGDPLPGVDVLLGGGWGEDDKAKDEDEDEDEDTNKDVDQNIQPGNKYLADIDLRNIDVENGGKYRVVMRTPGANGREILTQAARKARDEKTGLFGFFGVSGGHLPYQTADGGYNPVGVEYSEADIAENPTLADMTRAALGVLSANANGFWLMLESGDVDWANHQNNIDNSIGAVLSGDAAFQTVVNWVEKYNKWKDTVVIVTADHGHYFVLRDPAALIDRSQVAEK